MYTSSPSHYGAQISSFQVIKAWLFLNNFLKMIYIYLSYNFAF